MNWNLSTKTGLCLCFLIFLRLIKCWPRPSEEITAIRWQEFSGLGG